VADPGPRQPFRHQRPAERPAAPDNGAELAAIYIAVAVDRPQLERACIEELEQPARRLRAKICLVAATRRVHFRRVDVGDPDRLAAEIEGIAVDDAVAMGGALQSLKWTVLTSLSLFGADRGLIAWSILGPTEMAAPTRPMTSSASGSKGRWCRRLAWEIRILRWRYSRMLKTSATGCGSVGGPRPCPPETRLCFVNPVR
jgi:hypothetical protein